MKNFQGSFEKMNFLSANKLLFFFMIDFLVQNIIIIEEKDLEKADKITKKALKLFKKTSKAEIPTLPTTPARRR